MSISAFFLLSPVWPHQGVTSAPSFPKALTISLILTEKLQKNLGEKIYSVKYMWIRWIIYKTLRDTEAKIITQLSSMNNYNNTPEVRKTSHKRSTCENRVINSALFPPITHNNFHHDVSLMKTFRKPTTVDEIFQWNWQWNKIF